MSTRHKHNEDSLLLALACGATVEAAARQCGITERTVYRRLQDPECAAKLRQLRSDMAVRAAGALTAASTESVRTLLHLQKESHPPAVRLGAARAVLEIGMKLREVVDLVDPALGEQPDTLEVTPVRTMFRARAT